MLPLLANKDEYKSRLIVKNSDTEAAECCWSWHETASSISISYHIFTAQSSVVNVGYETCVVGKQFGGEQDNYNEN